MILDKFQVLRADASWPFSLCMTVIHLTGPISGCLNKYISVRLITFIGCCLASLGIALCYFAQSVFHITLAIGLLQGFGIGLTYIQNSAIINAYFVKYRGTANGISLSGGTIGAFIISSGLEHTLKEYPLKYSFLLLAAIITLTLPVSCMLREPSGQSQSLESAEDEAKKRKLSISKSGHSINTCSLSSDSCGNNGETRNHSSPGLFAILGTNYWSIVPGLSREKRFSLCNDSPSSSKVSLVKTHSFTSVFSGGKHNNSVLSESLSDISSNVSLIKYASNGKTLVSSHLLNMHQLQLPQVPVTNESIHSIISPKTPGTPVSSYYHPSDQIFVRNGVLINPNKLPCDQETTVKDNSSITLSCCSCDERNSTTGDSQTKLTQSLTSNVRDITRNPIFILIALTHASYFWSVITFTMVIVDYSLDAGLPMNSSVTLLNSFSIGDLIGRLVSGIVLDSCRVKLKHISLFAITGIGGLMIATPALAQLNYSYQLLIMVNICMGLLSGLINVLLNNLFCFYIGSDLAALAFGLSAFISGILTLARPSLVGYFRDRSGGSYDGLFITLGIASLITGALWLSEPWINSSTTQSQRNKTGDTRHTGHCSHGDSCHSDRRNSATSCSSASSSASSCCDGNCIHHKSNTSIDTEKTLVFPSEENVSTCTKTFVPETHEISTQKCKLDHVDDG